MSPHPCRLFIFDLDGTLIDSRADISRALNLALSRMNMKSIAESRLASFVGEGVHKLMQRTLREATGVDPEEALIQRGIALYQEEYGNHFLDQTRLCSHVKETLDRLSWANLAVVSNKPEKFSRHILEVLGLGNRFCAILGEDSTPQRKPDPAPLLHAMANCRCIPSETVMVGDSAVDIQAGKAAGVITCGVCGGFRPREELEAAGCDLLIENISDLTDHFYPL